MGRGSDITLFSPNFHSKRFPVTSLRFTELNTIQCIAHCAAVTLLYTFETKPNALNLIKYFVADTQENKYSNLGDSVSQLKL